MRRTYHIETHGCQMNAADSLRLATELDRLGFRAAGEAGEAGIMILNTCVVRDKPERKARARIEALQRIRRENPGRLLAVMGCLVGHEGPAEDIRARYPDVDFFLPPSDPGPLLRALAAPRPAPNRAPENPASPVCALVPAVLGCSFACSYCIIPLQRGPERSRPVGDILAEIRALVTRGAREATLLGQIIDRYGCDLKPRVCLAELLRRAAGLPGLHRVRFLTSHPRWIDDELLHTVAGHPKICPHFEIPIQAGSDRILRRMRRGVTVSFFRERVAALRALLPEASVHTDIIVGFPGETERDFEATAELLETVRFDMVHLARYSPRPGTPAAARFEDDVPGEEKERRRQELETRQRRIQEDKNKALVGSSVEVLVEGRRQGHWYGRTPQHRLVFFDDDGAAPGLLRRVTVRTATAFSLTGTAARG